MKKTTILLCVFALSFQQSFAVGLNSEVLAKRTNLHRLSNVINIFHGVADVRPFQGWV